MPEQYSPYKFSNLQEKTGDKKAINIIYQNEKLKLPFKLENLSYFVDPAGETELASHPHHHRAAWLPDTAIRDDQGNIYFETTIKGLGYLYPESYQSKKDNFYGQDNSDITVQRSVEDPWGYKVLGLFDRRNVSSLIENIKKMKQAGLRCEELAGALDLKKVLLGGEPADAAFLKNYLIDEAKKQNFPQKYLDDLKGFEPALLIRVLRDNTRIQDFCSAAIAEKREILTDVFKRLNLENEYAKKETRYDISDPESIKKYLEDFFAQSGKNLAIMQNNGAMMTYLNSGNITLSLGEVVDLDSIIFLNKGFSAHITPDAASGIPKGFKKDIRDQIYALGKMFANAFDGLIRVDGSLREKLTAAFLDNYGKNINSEKIGLLKIDPDKVKKVVAEFAGDMIARNRSVAPIKLA
ncbi:hypothetical protein A2303_03125 [Candidatus Falkowbacteria bacterium RIFOXYB2_FULL_47_14]|uniref:Uncharacterized protein n=1 Tax=Candidatus Falkowbacteria bacterium RIFOXYA2_FULL_47_19 TaxID=1797994 RepID=A0A1F5SFA2_9BACT|nr:MAG: hypothetical protein A2227_07850 [Candidatus Falkowbacteria bacterium RIFOXYA2_FULL_47_19]OGF35181.1 MAG: hypothetical protein A2468_01960 [Candidatus Falkowbacteria bacterium RIFOXYC2_FULL_46_15]OGF43346.1 MAG: hypothetical protein A2303_03125 [Candidatus Falkowbacteria bacterium RIFOXYB2_FULL_47_14]